MKKGFHSKVQVNGTLRTVRTRQKTCAGNFRGWFVYLDGVRYFSDHIDRDRAVDACVSRARFDSTERR